MITDTLSVEHPDSIETLFHLHPRCRTTIEQSYVKVICGEAETAIIYDHRRQSLQIREWFYVPEFGNREDNVLLVFTPKRKVPGKSSFILSPLMYLADAMDYWKRIGDD